MVEVQAGRRQGQSRVGHGEARQLHDITAVARRCGPKPAVVNAAFGFLQDTRRPRGYVDVRTADEFTLGLLPTDAATAAAFALSQAVCPQTCGLAVA